VLYIYMEKDKDVPPFIFPSETKELLRIQHVSV
jgi:hypothetical protein